MLSASPAGNTKNGENFLNLKTMTECEICGQPFEEDELQYNNKDQLVCERCQDSPAEEIIAFNRDFIEMFQASHKW